MYRTIITAAILALGVSAAQAGTAATSMDVSYGDLNLAHAKDGQILADRLQAAAHAVCTGLIDSSQYAPSALHECETAATRRALSSIERQEIGNVSAHLSDADS